MGELSVSFIRVAEVRRLTPHMARITSTGDEPDQ